MNLAGTLTTVTDRAATVVTDHNRIVLLVMLVLTAGVVLGLTQEQRDAEDGADEGVIEGTDVRDAETYLDARYFDREDGTLTEAVYIQSNNGSVLNKAGLLAALDYQIAISNSESVTDAPAGGTPADGVRNPAVPVAVRLADDPDPDLATQRQAVADASSAAVDEAVRATLTEAESEQIRQFLPVDYEVGTSDAAGMRLLFTVTDGSYTTDTLSETATTVDESTSVTVFTTDELTQEVNQQVLSELAWLVVPIILLVLVVILGFAYRDVTDVVVSFTGVIVTLLWTFGLMGWLGLLGQQTGLVVPVLAIALSIDFSFHVFMRYRERRGPDDTIRDSLRQSTAAVMIAFVLVTVTAVVGFLPNLTNPVGLIRDLTVAFILAVLSAFVIFTTLVPALKVSADGLWERFGFDRTAVALGKGSYLGRVLGGSVTVAQRAGVVVIVLALVVGAAGGLAFTEVDRQQFQDSDPLSDPGWQSELPGPMAYELHETEAAQRLSFANDQFATTGDDPDSTFAFTQFLLRGDVATPETMQALATGETAAAAADQAVVLNQGGAVDVRSPLTAMQEVAANNPDSAFAEQFAAAAGTETSDPETLRSLVPQRNVPATLDAFVEAAPERAAELLERTDNGYASMRLLVPVQGGFGDDRATTMFDIEAEIDGATTASVTAVGSGTLNDAYITEIVDGIVTTMLLALAGVFVVLAVVYRIAYNSATLGLVTALPIALVLGLVFGGMLLLGEPLTAVTALIVSIAIGLGIDYNIHISDRFATELERKADVGTALHEATTGTGGALLGSAVTSTGTFALLIVAPLATFQSMGVILSLTLAASFLLSVFVLPSLLYQWARFVHQRGEQGLRQPTTSSSD